jgi:aspartyl/asparaginyl-tRNA synthetase
VRHTLAQAIHRFFDENNFFWVNTPIITGSDAEGAGALFRVSTLDLEFKKGAPELSPGPLNRDLEMATASSATELLVK